MNDVSRPQSLIGNDVFDSDGTRIGRVGNVYVDDATHEPEWVTVRTGLFGMKESFVPLAGASTGGGRITVEVTKDKVREAPGVDAEHGHLSDEQGQALYDHYGVRETGAGLRPAADESVTADSVPSPRGTCPPEALSIPADADAGESEPPDEDAIDGRAPATESREPVNAGAGAPGGGRHHSSESTPAQYRVSRTRTGQGRHRKEP